MSWLNFNDSLNNIKGQITNFANTVLAEDQTEVKKSSEESGNDTEARRENKVLGDDDYATDDSWKWSMDESKTDQLKTDETITNLKRRISELENENRDLLTSLDQLDQNHQQNNEELVKMKEKLGQEVDVVTDKYEILNLKYNKLASAEIAYKKKISELKNKYDELLKCKDNEDNLSEMKRKDEERSQMLEEISKLKKSKEALESLMEEKNATNELQLCQLVENVQELETENKALRIAIHSQDKGKKTEENSNIEKMKEKYENEMEELKKEIERIKSEKEQETKELDLFREEVEKQRYDEEENYKMKLRELQNQLNEYEKEKRSVECQVEVEIEEESIKRYLETLNDNLKCYFTEHEEIENPETFVSKFSLKISTLIENFETKCADLESKMFELSKTKTELQNEKNLEIEKLIQNSEMLTQELLKKSQEIKDFEEECQQLMKNNDLLINKLQHDKGLQTIFETNEDNVESLERQLENSNRKIRDLEARLSEFNKEDDVDDERQFNELFEDLDRSKRENEMLMVSKEDVEKELEKTVKERDENKVSIEKMRGELETTEYQFNEMIVNLETLNEEIVKYKAEIDSLISENDSLKTEINKQFKKEGEVEALKETLTGENVDLQSRNEELQKENSEKDNEIMELKKQLHEKLEENNRILKECSQEAEGEVEVIRKELEGLEKEKEELNLLIEKLKEESDNREKEKNVLSQELNEKRIENEELLKLIEESNVKFGEIEKQLKKQMEQNEEWKNVYESLCKSTNIEKEEEDYNVLLKTVADLKLSCQSLMEENEKLKTDFSNEDRNKKVDSETKENHHQEELQQLAASRNELIAIVQTKHQESLTYHAEIQRLSEILKGETEKTIGLQHQTEKMMSENALALALKNEEIEKLKDQVDFLRQKCDVLAKNMLEEQKKVENEKISSSDKEASLTKKLERLQSHLMEVEEHYTQELLQSEQKIATLQANLNDVEQREKDSSTIYTSVSIRANQQNEALQQQLQSITGQRDEYKRKLMEQEDEINVKSAALSNLQLVLEQFQRDRAADVVRETDRIRKQMKQEQKKQEDLKREMANMEQQLKESKHGLQAALRLTEQLEMSKNQISNLKEEITTLTQKLRKKENEIETITSQTDGKVDKSLIKNLIIGFVTSNRNMNKDQSQILKIIATVLDFNESDHNKVGGANHAQQQNTWLRSLLAPIGGASDLPPHESLSRAFVNFLENESKPRVVPSLLQGNDDNNGIDNKETVAANVVGVGGGRKKSTPTPLVLNEIVLPTFSDFPQQRNSSSILKGVLNDNNNQ